MGCASRYASRSVRVPPPEGDPAGFAGGLLASARTFSPDVVVPVTEAATLALLPVRESFAPAVLPVPSLDVVRRTFDKEQVLAAAGAAGIAVPAQAVVASPEGLDHARLPPLPNVAKGARSLADEGGRLVKTPRIYLATEAQRQEALRVLPATAFPLLVQQRIVGEGTGVFLLLWEGEVLAAFCHRRIREKPPSGGVSTCCESIPPDRNLIERATALLRSLDWSGVAMVEFKRDSATGVPYLMEINGRFWGSLQLAVDAGVDFPALLVAAALGRRPRPVTDWAVGVRSRWWWGDVDHLLARLRHSDAALHLPVGAASRLRTALDVLLPRRRQRGDVMRWSDPLPFVAETVTWLSGLVR
jgi:biotin carboxylase